MYFETVRGLMLADPFRPFVLVLSTGQRLEVGTPGVLALGNRTATLVLPDGRAVVVNFDDVAAVETEPEAGRTWRIDG